MKIKSVKGTNDYLPEQARIRDYLQNKILEVYTENGFEHIESQDKIAGLSAQHQSRIGGAQIAGTGLL